MALNINSNYYNSVNPSNFSELNKQEQVLAQKEQELFNTQAAEVDTFTSTTSASDAVSNDEIDALKDELDELKNERQDKLDNIDKIEKQVQKLAEQVKENISKALDMQENAIKEHKKDADKAVKENIAAYIDANKNGKGMTRDELKANIKKSIPGCPDVADAISLLVDANEQLDEIDSLLGSLSSLISEVSSLDLQIDAKNSEIEKAEKAAEEAAKAKSCDPIGFQTKDGSTYDFIIDDGNFDSNKDFLGADYQWSEMLALDSDGDNIVSSKELQAGNIKAVKTDANGNQSVVDLASEFGDNFSIDLASYSKDGSHSAIDSSVDSDNDGTVDQQLLGTFNVNVNGESINGYNTLDDIDWLNDKFGFNPSEDVASESVETSSEDVALHSSFLKLLTNTSKQLRQELNNAFELFGLSSEEIKSIDETAQAAASNNVSNFFASLSQPDEQSEENTEEDEDEELAEKLA